MLTCMIDFLSN